MDMRPLALPLILLGVLLILGGLLLYFGGSLSFLGKLPGDIRIERPNFKFYFPITTSILISLILTALFYLLSRLR
jgi:hypothetical protein